MRISELFSAHVVDEDGRDLGRVHDVRLKPVGRGSKRTFEVSGLAVGPSGMLSRAAHAWGYAEDRAQAPLLLKALTRRAVRESRFIPADRVLDWHPPELRISGSGEELEPLSGRLRHE